jgi:hypothetical protein
VRPAANYPALGLEGTRPVPRDREPLRSLPLEELWLAAQALAAEGPPLVFAIFHVEVLQEVRTRWRLIRQPRLDPGVDRMPLTWKLVLDLPLPGLIRVDRVAELVGSPSGSVRSHMPRGIPTRGIRYRQHAMNAALARPKSHSVEAASRNQLAVVAVPLRAHWNAKKAA